MGNDGGSIPTRRELVKEAARNPSAAALKESQQEQQEYLWKTDPISQKPLSRPIVSDCTGKLYNKDTILEFLVSGALSEEVARVTRSAPIKSLKDVVEVRFETGDDGNDDDALSGWKCPITGDRLGPPSVSTGGVAGKAVYLVPCGHVFSASAVKEVAGEKCVVCDTTYAANDVIPIIPTAEADVARLLLRAKTLNEKGLTHSLKKASSGGGKKRKKRDAEAEGTDGANGKVEGVHDEGRSNGKVVHDSSKVNGDDSNGISAANGINNSSTASLTAKVLEEGEAAKRRRRENDNVRSLFSNKDQSKLLGNNADFMTRGFSVPGTTKR